MTARFLWTPTTILLVVMVENKSQNILKMQDPQPAAGRLGRLVLTLIKESSKLIENEKFSTRDIAHIDGKIPYNEVRSRQEIARYSLIKEPEIKCKAEKTTNETG